LYQLDKLNVDLNPDITSAAARLAGMRLYQKIRYGYIDTYIDCAPDAIYQMQ